MAAFKPDMSCARVVQHKSSSVGAAERHNERKNETYENLNVRPERIPFNVHYKGTWGESYLSALNRMEREGKVSTRGLRKDATLFDEIVIDVNTMYFERNGGYEFAKQFYEDAFHFVEKKFGKEYVISAVMHADEINKAASEDLGKDVYHYHLHCIVLPVVKKEVLWSKRCKNPALVGTVKEVVNQISHSKKWASDIPIVNEKGEPVLRKNGKPKYRPSYSILQDELFEYMRECGYKDFERGVLGSSVEHLSSLQYQIEKDRNRLQELEDKIAEEQMVYEEAHDIATTIEAIDKMGSKTLTRKIAVTKDEFRELTALAKEGITSRREISSLREKMDYYMDQYYASRSAMQKLQAKYDALVEKVKVFLEALENFPDLVREFVENVKQLFRDKEAREQAEQLKEQRKAEREARKAAREELKKAKEMEKQPLHEFPDFITSSMNDRENDFITSSHRKTRKKSKDDHIK